MNPRSRARSAGRQKPKPCRRMHAGSSTNARAAAPCCGRWPATAASSVRSVPNLARRSRRSARTAPPHVAATRVTGGQLFNRPIKPVEQASRPHAGMVGIRAMTISRATCQRTADTLFAAPTAMMAPVMVWVVDTGMPSHAVKKRVMPPPVSAQKPCVRVGEFHSITRSARARTPSGMAMPRAFAVFRLTDSSIMRGCSTGNSAGSTPSRSFFTYLADRR